MLNRLIDDEFGAAWVSSRDPIDCMRPVRYRTVYCDCTVAKTLPYHIDTVATGSYGVSIPTHPPLFERYHIRLYIS